MTKRISAGQLNAAAVGKIVRLMGWVHRRRDHGGLIFIDLRDRSGLIQLVVDPKQQETFALAEKLRSEYVISALGKVRLRPEGTANPKLATGEVEIEIQELEILSEAQTPPFQLDSEPADENLRLRYRYLDLRRQPMQENLLLRHKVVKTVRDFLDQEGFWEIETPMLTRSTPEGARDYLVPSRVHPWEFYALPQSPQLFKQLLMVGGMEKYFQVARCFRDEDLRADRQPEFTQIDLEMSFVDAEDVMAVGEGFIREVYQKLLQIDIPTPLRRMTWDEAMERFGSDKPDLRFGMELTDLSAALKGTGFRVFAGALAKGGSVRGINLKGKADSLGRKDLDRLGGWVRDYGAKGLAWTRLSSKGESSSYEKFLAPEQAKAVRAALGAQPGDVLFLVADADRRTVCTALGALRCELARRFGLIDPKKISLLWVTDFPLFEYSKEENRWVSMHHPFTMPRREDIDKLESDPGGVLSYAYDMVLNGNEVGGGSIRIHDRGLQQRIFRALGISPEQARVRFGFLTDAFRYGAPPHGGMAFGLDRLAMVMLGCDSIRDVIAFPKVASSAELMSDAPTDVDEKQLAELGIAALPKK